MRPSSYVEGLKSERKLYTAAGNFEAEATCTVGIALLLALDAFWVRLSTQPAAPRQRQVPQPAPPAPMVKVEVKR